MVTVQATFAEDPEDLTIAYAWPEVTGSDVTGRGPVRKYVLHMCNPKLRNIRLSGAFFTGSDNVRWPEEVLSGLTFLAALLFPVLFFLYFLFPVLFFPVVFSPYYFSRTCFPIFFHVFLFLYFFPYFLFFLFFSVFFCFFRTNFPFFFWYFFPRNFFHVFFSCNVFPRTYFSCSILPYFFQKLPLSYVLKYQWVVFLVHVVITQFMFLAEYSFKRHS